MKSTLAINNNKNSILKKSSLLSNFSISDREEEKVIEEALTTPYEKVIKILLNLKKYLEYNKTNKIILDDLIWVIERIQSHTLYTYEVVDNQSTELQKISENSKEVKSFLDYLNNYSESKDIQRRNRAAKFQTVKESTKLIDGKKLRKNSDLYSPDIYSHRQKQNSLFNTIEKQEKTIDNNDNNLEDRLHKLYNNNNNNNFNSSNTLNIKLENFKEKEDKFKKIEFQTSEFNPFEKEEIKLPQIDLDLCLQKDFDIFNFNLIVGRDNTLILGSKAIIEHFDVDLFISSKHLNNFLKAVKDKYLESSPYHNDLHGLDVCLTIGSYLNYSSIIQTLYLADLDIASIIIAALVHDLGHPGYTNMFQINSLSDCALTYNDISVLENYHISETFKLMYLNKDNDIFQNLNKEMFKIIRRRIIEAILATDMTLHAKINSTVKNKVQLKNIIKGENNNKLIETESKTFFDDQQEMINFLVHTADLSHNSKKFELSYKWTYLLMDEFWRQGDLEKQRNLPVSFLCDRNTSDVPKSQIGFIRGIIIPTFDILIDIWPSLNFYKENVNKNLDEWAKIITNSETK